MSRDTEPLDRLAATFRVEIDESTRNRHLAAVSSAVRSAPPDRTPRFGGIRRRLAVGLASLMGFVSVAGVAVAAEDALPGELLYPVKRVTERVRSVFDDDLAATHRVEEVETLVDRGADPQSISEALDRAEDAVVGLDDPGELAVRLERTRERTRQRGPDDPGVQGPAPSTGDPVEIEDPGQSGEQDPEPDPGPGSGPDPNEDPGTGSGNPNPGSGPTPGDGTTGQQPEDGGGDQGGSGSPGTGGSGGSGGNGSEGTGGGGSGGNGGSAGNG